MSKTSQKTQTQEAQIEEQEPIIEESTAEVAEVTETVVVQDAPKATVSQSGTTAKVTVSGANARVNIISPVDSLRKELQTYAANMAPGLRQTPSTMAANQKHLVRTLDTILNFSETVFAQAMGAALDEFKKGGDVFTEKYLLRGIDLLVREKYLSHAKRYQLENMITAMVVASKGRKAFKDSKMDLPVIVNSFINDVHGNRFGSYFSNMSR